MAEETGGDKRIQWKRRDEERRGENMSTMSYEDRRAVTETTEEKIREEEERRGAEESAEERRRVGKSREGKRTEKERRQQSFEQKRIEV